jgi:multidrug efflux pump subunit AcrA (membrane-fusion protein)
MSAKQTYTVRSPVRHGQKDHRVGAQIELDDETARPLLAVGAIGHPDGTEPIGSGEDDEYLERKADLDARERALADREQAVSNRQAALDELMQHEDFRAIALRYATKRVVEGKAEGDFTKGGLPTTEAISREALGIECSARERDALFAELYPPKQGG